MAHLVDEIKSSFRSGNVITRLIMVNLAVFLVCLLARLIFVFGLQDKAEAHEAFLSFISWIAVPYDIVELLFKPWTLITHMFVQYDFWHLFWNMILLFMFGKIFMSILGQSKILAVYVYGGFAGVALSMIFHYAFPGLPIGNSAIGASAAICAVMFMITATVPNYELNFILIGPVKIKYILLVLVVFDLLNIANLDNMGGHVSHLGGSAFGYWFFLRDRQGKNPAGGFNRLISVFSPRKGKRSNLRKTPGGKRRFVPDEDYNLEKKSKEEELNAILDKIGKSGYESLSKDEKDKLFRYSQDQ